MSESSPHVYVVTARSNRSGDTLLLRAFALESEARDFVRNAERNELCDDGQTELRSHVEVLGLRLRIVSLRVEQGMECLKDGG